MHHIQNNFKNRVFAGVCTLGASPKIADILNFSTCMIGKAILPLLLALAIAVFIYGVIQYAINAQEEKKREEGKKFITWGIVAVAVIVSIWGLIALLTTTFQIGHAAPGIQTVVQ